KSQTTLNVGAELDALGATARGDGRNGSRGWDSSVGNTKARTAIDDDDDSSFESQAPSQMHHVKPYHNAPYSRESTYSSYSQPSPMQSQTFMPAAGYGAHSAPGSRSGQRPPPGASPWQRGAGYD
ncbi:MAG: hypothetical protein INR71_07295, partial [Terriglobus roseus]|nr:hypothetical protein [Terriglobus roseus]